MLEETAETKSARHASQLLEIWRAKSFIGASRDGLDCILSTLYFKR